MPLCDLIGNINRAVLDVQSHQDIFAVRHCNAILFFPNAQLGLGFLEVADIHKNQQIGTLGKITQSFANAFDP